jgi:hypothetical protein
MIGGSRVRNGAPRLVVSSAACEDISNEDDVPELGGAESIQKNEQVCEDGRRFMLRLRSDVTTDINCRRHRGVGY